MISEMKTRLEQIRQAIGTEAVPLISDFQRRVWEECADSNARYSEALLDLAYDLEYYEPDEKARAEDASFFDEVKLRQKIDSAIEQLERP